MGVKQRWISVGTTPTLLTSGDTDSQMGQAALIRNRDASKTVYVGGSNVTAGEGTAPTTNGFPLDAGESIPADFFSGNDLYGIVAIGTAVCPVLEVGA